MTDEELKKQLKKVDWPIDYGNIKIQIRQRKPTLVTIERTIRLDTETLKPKITTRAPVREMPSGGG